ncbi:tRNA (adenosine(37)-N6)-dimethylallyltransferase MiaA [Phenylobacterium sp.]|jgi:tRNA dimethylallyltransferase|uniref:tRNA (adenosine(37)-N6)-dimethylallyltransferase MiaA n=1 Tax=Phenylobacterium sp. TaxID=1871053 RepID=UPI000C8E0F24|nr:tRNA (adenosine(37)-N6)-dimethylallyltransferase MiaA [Phenylobacterium sp.]MAK80629.1 tRNA (adenosine(37)-N6)-dimethylallyltransferase MiaA [Phenylobacterium sp.]|tara:strand:+ start:31672 stop:32592 length:921 start_codon:yes stop_codon:yes gene_type:complete
MEPRIWLIGGPTASGKTAISLRLAREIGGEIVNADSIQLYRDLEILSARPAPDELGQAPHHLFGVADAAEAWSVGRWQRAALPLIADIRSRGKSPILVGGTGLYFRSLTHGLAEIPTAATETRAAVAADFETLGEAAFRDRLAQVDPTAAARIAPGDRQRLARAWEVYLTAGQSLSTLQTQTTAPLDAGDWRGVAIDPPRAALYARCDARLAGMVEAGAAAEVSALLARRLDPDLPVMKALGLAEIAAWQAGAMSLDEALAAARQATRRYAKRQATWFRNQTSDWPRITAADPEARWGQFLALGAP